MSEDYIDRDGAGKRTVASYDADDSYVFCLNTDHTHVDIILVDSADSDRPYREWKFKAISSKLTELRDVCRAS